MAMKFPRRGSAAEWKTETARAQRYGLGSTITRGRKSEFRRRQFTSGWYRERLDEGGWCMLRAADGKGGACRHDRWRRFNAKRSGGGFETAGTGAQARVCVRGIFRGILTNAYTLPDFGV